jgi:hypothetical protein
MMGRIGNWKTFIITVRRDPEPKSKTPQPIKGCTVVGIMRKGRMKLPAMAMRTSSFRDEGWQIRPSPQGPFSKHDFIMGIFSAVAKRCLTTIAVNMVIRKKTASAAKIGLSEPYLPRQGKNC